MKELNIKFQRVIESLNVANAGLNRDYLSVLAIHNIENISYSLEELSNEYDSVVEMASESNLLRINTDRLFSIVFALTSLYRLALDGEVTINQIVANLALLIERLIIVKSEYSRLENLSK